MTKPVHLWWLWNTPHKDGTTPAAALKETGLVYTLCGQKDISREEATVFMEDATCELCKFRARQEAA